MTTKTDARTELADKIAELADTPELVVDEFALDPIADALLIAQITEGNLLKKEAGRIKRKRDKINAAVREGLKSKGHTILTVNDEPVVELTINVKKTTTDWEMLARLAPVAFAKSTTTTFDGETLNYK